MLIALQGAVSQGVLWGIMVLGVFITFRLLDIPDMTCDGSFALGGCVCAVLIVNNNVDPLIAVRHVCRCHRGRRHGHFDHCL